MMPAEFVVSRPCKWGKKTGPWGLTNGRKSVGAEIAQPQPAAIVTAVVGTKMHRGLNDTRASVGRRHRIRSHGRPVLGMGCLVLTQDTGGLWVRPANGLGSLE